MSQKIVVKIRKDGFSRTIASGFGFGSWTIGATSMEVDVEIDPTTEEGKAEYRKVSDVLANACMKALERDIELARKLCPELDSSIKKREALVNKALDEEEKHA